jgi:hypothetical protein
MTVKKVTDMRTDRLSKQERLGYRLGPLAVNRSYSQMSRLTNENRAQIFSPLLGVRREFFIN